MQPGEVFIPREAFGAQLSPPTVRFSSELSEEAKTAWFVLAMYAAVEDAAYPPLSRLKHLLGVGCVGARRLIGELEELGLIEARPCAGSRKRRFVFVWAVVYEKKVWPPKKPPMSDALTMWGALSQRSATD